MENKLFQEKAHGHGIVFGAAKVKGVWYMAYSINGRIVLTRPGRGIRKYQKPEAIQEFKAFPDEDAVGARIKFINEQNRLGKQTGVWPDFSTLEKENK